MRQKALVVEDNENNRYLLTLLLEQADFVVVAAVGGRRGLELARLEMPDVILLDIQMPEMDGYEVAARLRSDPELTHIPIVGVSSFAMPGDHERAIKAGFAGYIEKPIDPELFAGTVVELIEKARGRNANPQRG
jgi:two-component system cell cycle response regulator DivK